VQRPSYLQTMKRWPNQAPGFRHNAVLVALVATVLVLGGCRQFQDHRVSLASLHAAGRYDQAAAILDDPATQRAYGDRNEVLWHLDRGAIALALGDLDQAIELLETAEHIAEVQREKSGGDILAQWTLNDSAAKYIAQPYEDMYINVLKLLAQLRAGRLDGGATVEARRLASKADFLRDMYLKYEEALEQEHSTRVASRTSMGASHGGGTSRTRVAGSATQGGITAVNPGEFLESPLGTFLSAVTFMKSGDYEFQRVAARRLLDSLQLQRGLVGPVREEDFAGLEDLDPAAVNVLVVALSGRGPTKYAHSVGPIPLGTVPIYFELPYLRVHPSEVAAARIEVEGFGSEHSPHYRERLKLVEDMSLVAAENHRRMLPLIHKRTLLRYAMKATASVVATELARKRVHDRDQGIIQITGVLLGLMAIAATEQADLRAWVFLPGQARVGLLKLPPGEHRVRIVYESALGSAVYATAWETVHVQDGREALTSVVTHYWR
jgi:uncharacterized protein